jgi:UMF1 family MFS transporter
VGWQKLYPLRGMPHQGQIWSWISFDVANQSFTLIINTLLFPIFFKQIVAASSDRADTLWAIIAASSMVLVVLASPIAGAIADERSWKKEALVITGFACALLTCALGLIQPGQLWLAVLLYIPANFMFSIGENFLAAFLPQLAPRESFGRISGFSWACAYAAALLLLVLTAAGMLALGLEGTHQWRPFFVFAGLWFIAFAIPTLLKLREPDRPRAHAGLSVFTAGFTRLGESLRRTREFRDLATLLLASLLYGAGMNVIVFFASILAVEFGFESTQLVIFVAVITVSGVAGTLIPTLFQDRLGHKRTVLLLLFLWLFTALGFAGFSYLRASSPDPSSFPTWPLWLFGNLIGFGLGSLGAANRAFVGYFTPRERTAEVFGLWGMIFKLAAVLTIPFAYVKDTVGTTASLLVLAGFILAGLLITLAVNEARGVAAARAADQDGV